MTTSTPSTITPGLAAVRARQAELAEQAERIAATISAVDDKSRRLRYGLKHIAGMRFFAPYQDDIDELVKLGLVELHRGDLAPVCGRYRPTGLGVEVLGLLGRGGR